MKSYRLNTRLPAASVRSNRRRGFSLIELLIVLAIVITVLTTLGVPAYQRAQQQGQIASALRMISSAKSTLALYTASADWNGQVPITEGTGIPLTGTMGGATNTVIGDATTLQTALLSARTLDAPLSASLGSSTPPTGATTTPVLFNMTTQTFSTTGDAAPTQSFAATTRLECRMSAPATAPSVALGANFRLDGTNNVPANTRLVYCVFPNVTASAAYEFARSTYKGIVAAQGAAQDAGPVVYAAADANGNTTVYAYVSAH